MNVERQLQICMAALAALGTLLLGLGQRDAWLPMAAALAAIVSVYVVDIRQWLSLNRNLANIAALLAVVVSVVEFRRAASDEQLLAIANLLIYLQLVLLFQVKTDRVYWQLVVLSLLQVVVAAALNMGFEFGVLLCVYLAIAMTSLFLFFVRRETRLVAAAAEEEEANEWLAFGTTVRGMTEVPPEEGKKGAADDVAEEPAAPANSFAQVALPDSPDEPPARPLPGWSMVREVFSLSVVTLLFAVVLFYAVPRSGDGDQRGLGGKRSGSIGFNPDGVKLGDMGRISEDDRTALRITLYDSSGDPLILPEPLYLRGAVLARYGGSGAWSGRARSRIPSDHAAVQTLPSRPAGEIVRQEITIEQPEHNVLFAIFPAYDTVHSDGRARAYPLNEQILGMGLAHEQDARRPPSYRYLLGTTNIRHGRQSRFSPFDAMALEPRWPAGMNDQEKAAHLSIDTRLPQVFDEATREFRPDPDAGKPLSRYRKALPRLMALASQIVKDIPEEHRLERCQAIENHFRFSKDYQYTLDFSGIPRRDDLDQVEYFVAEHRQGNCRYFASAAALMLRSLGIETRVITGFKGGEFNAVGGFYVVKQRDAHAWVEAYIPFADLPPEALPSGEPREGGAWYRLDPTPDVEDLTLTTFDTGPLAWMGQSLDYAQVLWNDYVVTLNSERQQEAIFRPLLDRTTGALERAFQASTWRAIFEAAAGWVGLGPESWFVQYWYLWLGLVIVPAAALGGWLAWRFSPSFLRILFTGRWTDPNAKDPAQSRVPFYAKLEQLLAGQNLVRAPGQTPREFALALAADLAEVPFLRDAVPLVRQVTEAYYRVRFGGERLSWDEQAEIERDLVVLQRALGAQLAPAA